VIIIFYWYRDEWSFEVWRPLAYTAAATRHRGSRPPILLHYHCRVTYSLSATLSNMRGDRRVPIGWPPRSPDLSSIFITALTSITTHSFPATKFVGTVRQNIWRANECPWRYATWSNYGAKLYSDVAWVWEKSSYCIFSNCSNTNSLVSSRLVSSHLAWSLVHVERINIV
jgi:hypothetical protein